MKKAIILSGICFTVGNVIWPLFDEPKLFYVPLAFLILTLLIDVKRSVTKDYEKAFFDWLVMLAAGNVVKQLFYSEKLAQINDYVFGAIITVWLIYKLGRIWAIKTPL